MRGTLASRGMRRVCVYAGSNRGADPAYAQAAERLAALLAERGIGVVYGGGKVGPDGRAGRQRAGRPAAR